MVYVYDNLGKKIQINYEIIGEGKPIVMVHSLACDMNLMKGCMEPVFEKVEGYKRLYLDLPGMGKSESAEELASSDKMMEVLLSFIKSTISGNFLIVGESYGGYLVRGILSVIMDRIEGMALICPVIFPENEDRILPKKTVIKQDEGFLRELYEKNEEETESFLEMAVIINKKTYDRYKKEIYSGIKISDMNFIRKLKKNYSFSFDVDKKIDKKFDRPVLFMAGKQDNITGYKQLENLCEKYSRGTMAVIDESGHNLQIEKPEIFEVLIKDWLKRILNMDYALNKGF